MRFQPKRRASNDQCPGPIKASETPRPASSTLVHRSPCWEIMRHTSKKVTIVPAIGVHKPIMRRNPAPNAMPGNNGVSVVGVPRTNAIAKPISAIPVVSRRTRRPAPGQPRANDENNRRMLDQEHETPTTSSQAPKGSTASLFRGTYNAMMPRLMPIIAA